LKLWMLPAVFVRSSRKLNQPGHLNGASIVFAWPSRARASSSPARTPCLTDERLRLHETVLVRYADYGRFEHALMSDAVLSSR
jgi:hypothetical protein